MSTRRSISRVAMPLLLALPFVYTLQLYSQGFKRINQATRHKIDPLLLQSLFTKEQFPDRLSHPLRIMSQARASKEVGDFVGVLIESENDIRAYIRSLGGNVGSRHGNIYTALIPVNTVAQVVQQPSVSYIEASRPLYPSLNLSISKTGADVLHSLGEPTKRLTGKDIIIGFTDTGINTEHPNFRTANGKTRILYVWDQYSDEGQPPAGFTYGTEKDSAAINAGTWSMVSGGVLHGTHVSGIAAGNGLPTRQFVGMAPEADLIMVSIIDEDMLNRGMTTVGVLDGYDYIRTKATALGKRFVINTSLGTNLGPHDGTTLFEKAVNAYVAAGGIVCISAGNTGDQDFHASAVVGTSTPQEIECYIGGGNYLVPMDIWYAQNDRMTLRIKKSTDASYVTMFPPVDSTIVHTFESVTVSVTTKIGSPLNGDNEIYITFQPTSDVRMKLQFSADPGNVLPDGGRVDLWWEWIYPAYFLTNVDRTITVGMPAGADSAITVASYNNLWVLGGEEDHISHFSARGPRRDGAMKPDIAGTGGGIISSVGSSGYDMLSGTSMSSPHVAGAVALLLQQDPGLTSYEAKQKLLTSAVADVFTGDVPNATWGYGKLNVLKASGYYIGVSAIHLVSDTVDFESVFVQFTKRDSVVIRNPGSKNLTINSIEPSGGMFSVDRTSLVVAPLGQEKISITVTPTDTGAFSGYVEITSDDTSNPSVRITMIGRGEHLPAASISPDSLLFTLEEGQQTSSGLNIANMGQGPLKFEVLPNYSIVRSGGGPALKKLARSLSTHETSVRSSVLSELGTSLTLPLVVKDPVGDGYGLDVSEIRGVSASGVLTLQVVLAKPFAPSNFAGVIGLDVDQNAATGRYIEYNLIQNKELGCEFTVSFQFLRNSRVDLYDSAGASQGQFSATFDFSGNSISFSIPLNALGQDDGFINIASIFAYPPTGFTDWAPDSGFALLGVSWLSAVPESGIVQPGGSEPLLVQVATADLDRGTFQATLIMETNDPGKSVINIPIRLTVQPATNVEDSPAELPKVFALHQNYPNPFNPSTTIEFSVPAASFVSLRVYDILGRQVRTIVNEALTAGVYQSTFYGTGLPSGVYFYRLRAGDFVETKKLILQK